ncbi:hypothetical protein C8J56DRAFT_1082229, partial [Mycena floridula]
EYEAGRVICETCGRGVSFRDELAGAFSVKHWDAHRLTCSAIGQPLTVIFTEDVHSPHVHSPAKRRRAKRTEEERIEYLRGDPYVAEFEPYKVLCVSCDKWIRLRPNSTYCSIPWDAHRKSCLAKKITGKNVYALEERNTLFSKDPDIRKFDAERVLCATCDKWISINPDDHLSAVQIWFTTTAAFNSDQPSRSLAPHRPASPSPGHSQHSPEFNGQQHQSHMLPPNPGSPQQQTLWATNPTSTHESRRRNAEQRAAALRSDPLIRFVEPNRVFCSLCLKWVQLRQDSSYCAYPWLQHRGKCLKRNQRRAVKNRERSGEKKDKGRPVFTGYPPYPPHPYHGRFSSSEDEANDEPSSAMPSSSALGFRPSGMRDQPHSRQEPPKKKIKLEDDPEELDAEGSEDPDADGGPDDGDIRDRERERERERERSRPAMDLDNINARFVFSFFSCMCSNDLFSFRKLFIAYSITHLFSTTFTPHDNLTISALVSYLNGAMPQDRREDFDTSEVVKGVFSLSERGRVRLEGDVIK